MPNGTRQSPPRRRSVNMTIREDVMASAKALHLNASRAAEAGIVQAIREARERQWRNQNRAAIEQHNARISKDGVLIAPDWAAEP